MDLLFWVGRALDLYILAVVAWVILSWVTTSSVHPLGKVQAFLDRIINPVIAPIRRIVPPIRMGAGAIDLSPIILILGLSLLRRFI